MALMHIFQINPQFMKHAAKLLRLRLTGGLTRSLCSLGRIDRLVLVLLVFGSIETHGDEVICPPIDSKLAQIDYFEHENRIDLNLVLPRDIKDFSIQSIDVCYGTQEWNMSLDIYESEELEANQVSSYIGMPVSHPPIKFRVVYFNGGCVSHMNFVVSREKFGE